MSIVPSYPRLVKPSSLAALLALPLAAALSASGIAVAADWPHFRGPDRNGISTEEGLSPEGEAPVAWIAEVGLGYSAPVVQGGRVLISGHDGADTDTLYCLDEASGEILWRLDYPQPLGALYFQGGTTGSATFDGDRVYHLAREGELFCLRTEDGSVLWQRQLKGERELKFSKPTWGFSGAPLVRGDRLYLAAGEAGLALDKTNGNLLWRSKDEEAGYATPFPLSRNGVDYLIFTNKRAYVCVRESDGEEVWSERWMTRYGVNAADPIDDGEHLLISSGYGKGSTLLRWDGSGKPEKLWQNRELRSQMNAAVLIDGHFYGIDGNESVDGTGIKCVELATGRTVWSDSSVGHGALMAVRDQLLVVTEGGLLHVAAASPGGFAPTFSQQVVPGRVWTVPVYANGRAYVRNETGQLVVVNLGTR
jgi:outer membrane protein assembly factor BamB